MLKVRPLRTTAFFTPPVRPRLNRAHPLVNGMTSCWFPLFPGIVVDLFKDARVKSSGGTAAVGRFGQGISNATTWSVGAAADTSDLNWSSGSFTVALWADIPANGAGLYCNVLDRSNYVSEASNQGWLLQQRATDDGSPGIHFIIFNNNAIANYGFPSSVTSVAGTQFWAGKSDGVTKSNFVGGPAYGNGPLVKTASSSGSLTPASQTTNPLSGAISGTGAGSAKLYIAAIWNRLLSDQEIMWFYQEPFGIFLNPEDVMVAQVGRAPLPPPFDMGSTGIICLQ